MGAIAKETWINTGIKRIEILNDHILVSVLVFDDGTHSENILHIGSFQDCERIGEAIPAISYSGDKKVKESFLAISELGA